jgi:hypothetical protein
VLRLYDRCGGQWIYHPLSGLPTGLRAEAVEAAMSMLQIPVTDRAELFDQLLTLSTAIVSEINRAAAKEREKKKS